MNGNVRTYKDTYRHSSTPIPPPYQPPKPQKQQLTKKQCCLYYLTAQVGFHWVLLMIRRGEIRQRFGIEGSGVSDCCSSYWCPCCVIVQQEKEIEAQSERLQTGYQAPAGMAYAPQ